ncbi:MAG: L,D-transpeptidase family protein [Candidatus Omnitrophica bacterium]|nr:L,D-transpeptidase family protein [Candidatus Omnitrophota bacterium]
MNRQVLMRAVLVVAGVLGAGLLVWAGSQGWIGPHGGARRLLVGAERASQQGDWAGAQMKLEELIGTQPDSPLVDDALLALGGVSEQQQQLAEARRVYRLLLEQFPDSPLAGQAQSQLGAVNVALLFSPTVTDADALYEVKAGDSLGKIAAAHRTTVDVLQRANGLKGDLIHPRQKLKIPKGAFRIVVDKSQNELLMTQDNQFFKSYLVATGENGSTPTGTFKIVNKVPNPVWYRQGAVVPPDSPENILGTRWLGLNKQGYGIHGSVDPTTMGQQVTAGCVRMTNAEVEELFAIVPTGTEVTIVD